MYNEDEIQFLLQSHPVEHAAGRTRSLQSACDMRQLGCPQDVFFRVLKDRERRIGSRAMQEFRSRTPHASATPESDLSARINAGRLF